MAHPAPLPLGLAALLGLFVSAAAAQPGPAAEKPETAPPVFTDPAAAVAGQPAPAPLPGEATALSAHAMSSGLAATISTALPQYQAPAAAAPAAPAPLAQPKNQVPRLPLETLPQVTVRSKRIREFTERESYTAKGLEELAEKRYMSWLDHLLYNQGLPHFMVEKGLPMKEFEAAEDRERAKEMQGLWHLDALKDPDETPAAKSP